MEASPPINFLFFLIVISEIMFLSASFPDGTKLDLDNVSSCSPVAISFFYIFKEKEVMEEFISIDSEWK